MCNKAELAKNIKGFFLLGVVAVFSPEAILYMSLKRLFQEQHSNRAIVKHLPFSSNTKLSISLISDDNRQQIGTLTWNFV